MNDGVAPSSTTRILWRSAEQESLERFTGTRTPDGWRLTGLAVLPLDGEPAQIAYRVDLDGRWRTRRAEVAIERQGGSRRIALAADGEGAWSVDDDGADASAETSTGASAGVEAGSLSGCVDVDLGFTPATNTLPIRRFVADGLAVGETRSARVAWLTFPELEVRPDEQSYTRLAPDRWEFRSGDFTSELVVDPEGYVLRYGDDLWTAVLHRSG
jgi:hypothetical protein